MNLYEALLAFAEANRRMLEGAQGTGKLPMLLSWSEDGKDYRAYFGLH